MTDTIFALASGFVAAPIAIIRISGPQANAAVHALCGRIPPPRVASLAEFRSHSGTLIDKGLVLRFPSPASFTGEDCVEFQSHGGRAVISAMLASLAAIPGLRPASPGEFSKRAFLNGKIDLLEAEGLADVVAADTEEQLRQALGIVAGAFRLKIDQWRDQIQDLQAAVAADIDFTDEGDVANRNSIALQLPLNRLVDDMKGVLSEGRRGEIVRDGFSVVIAGPPNSGKSSLLNYIARRDVAIVSPVAGTTRDLVEVRLDLSGMPIVLIDTAGLRDSDDPVELEGMRRAEARAGRADLVLWVSDVFDPTDLMKDRFGSGPVLHVRSKADLSGAPNMPGVQVSSVTGTGIEVLLHAIIEFAHSTLAGPQPAIMSRERHRASLRSSIEALEEARHTSEVEIIAEQLRLAATALQSIIGFVDFEDVLGNIFSKFCIGK